MKTESFTSGHTVRKSGIMLTMSRTAVCAGLFALLAVTLAATPGRAAQRRFALLVGHPFGGDNLMPLRYVGHDVERMRQVLELLGDFAPEDVQVSFAEDAEQVQTRFMDVREQIAAHHTRTGEEAIFLFYYSGHAQDGELRLGETRLALSDVRHLLDGARADLRLAVLDSCRSGSITRMKGARKGDAVDVGVEEAASQRGLVLITASSAHEDAQESDEIQGSFFTHFLASGLRGAADKNTDGAVTLSEAYDHAYSNTVARTIGTRGGIQHPSYRFDLSGAGAVVLTRVDDPPSAIAFPRAMTGTFIVFDLDNEVVIAEFDKRERSEKRLAVRAGHYVVKKREVDHLQMQRMRVPHGGVAVVRADEMQRVAFADDYAKGAVVTVEEVRHGKVGIRLSTSLAAQAFLSAPTRDNYFPTLAILEVLVDFDNLLRRNLGVRLDVGFGGSGERSLALDDAFLGSQAHDVRVNQLTGGIALTYQYPLHEMLTVGAQGRLGLILLSRKFLDGQLPQQSFSTLTPGVGLEAAFHLTDWLRAGFAARLHYMFFNVDESQNLAYIDGGVVITVVLR